MKRQTYTMPEELLETMDKYSEKTGVPKSTLVQMAVKQYLDSQKMLETMPDMLQEMKKLMEAAKEIDGRK